VRSSILTVVLCAKFCATPLLAREQRHPYWSVDLDQYGLSNGRPGTATASYSESIVAATDNYVAVAFDVKEPVGSPPHLPAEAQSSLSLVIFDANNGKLSATCGPWIVSSWFNLWSTAGGSFLLHLTSLSDASPQGSETLLLVSPTCTELKRIRLPYQENLAHHSWQILQSPSRHTLLLVEEHKDGNDYQLRGSDSLELERQWFEPNSKAPLIIAVSDKGLLGVLPRPTSATSDASPIADYYRTFDGAWRRLPLSNYYSFLSDDALVGTTDSAAQSWSVSKTHVAAIRLDGTAIFSATVSSAGYHVARTSEILVSSDGDHFAFTLDLSGAGWFWGNLDMGPEHHSVYVWSASRPEPCAKIKLRSWLDLPSLAFAPGGSWFALLLDGSKLSVRPLP
jgi:hypothetical protein